MIGLNSSKEIELPSFKIGDTFFLDCKAFISSTEEDPQPLTGWDIRAQVRNRNGILLANLVVNIIDEIEGHYTLTALPEVTRMWTRGRAKMDIEYTNPEGFVKSTETIYIPIDMDETKDD